jgi:hypothetical protein
MPTGCQLPGLDLFLVGPYIGKIRHVDSFIYVPHCFFFENSRLTALVAKFFNCYSI